MCLFIVLCTFVAVETSDLVDAGHPLGQLALQAQRETFSAWNEKQRGADVHRDNYSKGKLLFLPCSDYGMERCCPLPFAVEMMQRWQHCA